MTTPNPGSLEARKRGCRCDTLDNHYGQRVPSDGWCIAEGCPVHQSALDQARLIAAFRWGVPTE